jgi:hypothetical protein
MKAFSEMDDVYMAKMVPIPGFGFKKKKQRK